MRTDTGDSVTGKQNAQALAYVRGPRLLSDKKWEVELRGADGSRTLYSFAARRAGQSFVDQLLAEGKAQRQLRGFAVMTKERHRAIASLGGAAAQESGKAHQFTPEEARVAGLRGGAATSRDREHMADIGRKGGIERGRRARERRDQRARAQA